MLRISVAMVHALTTSTCAPSQLVRSSVQLALLVLTVHVNQPVPVRMAALPAPRFAVMIAAASNLWQQPAMVSISALTDMTMPTHALPIALFDVLTASVSLHEPTALSSLQTLAAPTPLLLPRGNLLILSAVLMVLALPSLNNVVSLRYATLELFDALMGHAVRLARAPRSTRARPAGLDAPRLPTTLFAPHLSHFVLIN